jgi:hypothetical protein
MFKRTVELSNNLLGDGAIMVAVKGFRQVNIMYLMEGIPSKKVQTGMYLTVNNKMTLAHYQR